MHVLHVETGRQMLGGTKQTLWLLDGLAGSGIRSHLACIAGSPLYRAAGARGHPVTGLQTGGDADPRLAWTLYRLIRQLRPDVVHLHSRRGADSWGLLAARAASVPVVLSRRVDNPEPVMLRWKYRFASRVIAISAGVEQQLRHDGVAPEKIRRVRSAVVMPGGRGSPVPWPEQRFRDTFRLAPEHRPVGLVAQMIERKGHAPGLEAFAQLHTVCPQARLLVFGSGRLEAELRARTAASGLNGVVTFAGYRDDLAEFIGHFELLLHPAVREGLGVVLLEAQAAGVPVIGFDVPGVNEAVVDGQTGLLVHPGDTAALAAAVRRLLDDGRLRARLSANARTRMATEFSLRTMCKSTTEIYQEVCAGFGRGL